MWSEGLLKINPSGFRSGREGIEGVSRCRDFSRQAAQKALEVGRGGAKGRGQHFVSSL